MAILVDQAIWPWRGRRWAHLVSDADYEELHEFASRLGIPRRAFQGDHYDLPSEYRDAAIALGAEAVDGRELVSRLRGSGLRLRPEQRRQLPTEIGPGSWSEGGVGPVSGVQAGPIEEDGEHG